MRLLMYNWHTSIICCSVGLGMVSLRTAISSVDSGRCMTLLSFMNLFLMSSSVTSGVLCVIGLVAIVDVLGVSVVMCLVCSTFSVVVVVCW